MAFERLSSAHPLTCRPLAVWQDIPKPAKGRLGTRRGRNAGEYRFLTVIELSFNLIAVSIGEWLPREVGSITLYAVKRPSEKADFSSKKSQTAYRYAANTKGNGEWTANQKIHLIWIHTGDYYVRSENMIKMSKLFPMIGAVPWVAALCGILISIAIIPWSEIGDAPPLGVMMVWGRILAACNLLAILIVLIGVAATWRCTRRSIPCGRILIGTTIALLMPLVSSIAVLIK
jgi:hypothetical protein